MSTTNKEKNKYVFNYWKIGTNTNSYIETKLFNFLKSNWTKFQNNTLNFTQEELNKEDPKNAKNAVFMQAAKTLSFIGVLKEENKEYFWTTKFLNKFQKFDQSFLENKEQFIQEIYDFGSEELINKIDAYVEFLKQNYENSNDEEESDFRENLQKRILLADSNWIHSILIDFDVEGETLSEDNNWILEYKKIWNLPGVQKVQEKNYWKTLAKNTLNNKKSHINEKCKDILKVVNYLAHKNSEEVLFQNFQYTFDKNKKKEECKDYDKTIIRVDRLQTTIKTVLEYFNWLRKKHIYIPFYQRKYSWNKDYLERLIDDIELLADKYPSHSFKKGENYHFLSTITTKSKGHSNKNEIIDGQQRTITLIFTNFALFKYLCQRKIKDYEIPWIYDSMFNNSYDNQDYDNQDFVGKWIDNPSKLNGLLNFSKLFENNIEAIQDIWGGKKINGKESKPNKINQDEGEKQLKENLIYIYSYLSNKLDQKDDLYVKDFVERLLYGFVINHVEVQEGASEQIFERMNLMSKKLNNLEMLKAYIYERLINKDLEDKEIQINLENFMQLFYSFFIKGKPKAENLEVTESPNLKLFTTYLNNKYELKMNSNYEYSPLYIIKKFLEIHSNEAKDDSWLEALLLEKLKFQYSLIKNQEHFNNWKNDFDKFKKIYPKREKTSNPDLIEWLFPFVSMASKGNVTVFLPLVIFILDSFEILDKKIEGGETKKLSIWREVIKLLFEIERFTFIWKTAKFEGQSLSRGVYILIDKLKKESNLTAQALRKGLFELVFNNQKVLLVDDKFILDDEFKLTIYNEIDNNFKNNVDSKSRNSEYTELMFRIIWYLKNSRNSFPRLNSWWHIGEFEVLFKEPSWDHFYATNSKIKNLDIESNEDKDKLINSIGNGFILQSSLNSKYKNNSVEEKYDNLKKQTGIFLSFVNSQEGLEPLSKEWNSEKIEKRRDDIVELIKEIYLKS